MVSIYRACSPEPYDSVWRQSVVQSGIRVRLLFRLTGTTQQNDLGQRGGLNLDYPIFMHGGERSSWRLLL